MSRFCLFLVLSVLPAFAAEGAIKFQIPTSADGAPAAAPPPKQEAPQKLGLTSNRPLNLAELSVKDTASFDTYSQRRALVQDSISAMQIEIENAKKRTQSFMTPLEPKGEFEKQAEFDVRRAKWDKELGEKMLRDSKPFSDRLAELERAKKKIEDNQAALYCELDIKTSPNAATIQINKEDIGISPMKYKFALPGQTVIKIQKDNYEPWDTTLILQPAQEVKINVVLQEKSIFSKEGEIDFPKTLARDSTIAGYRQRIRRVEARIEQIDGEIKTILEDFANTYPALEPQKPEETLQAFEQRKTIWYSEGERQVDSLNRKHELYKNKLECLLKILEDNIIATESQLIAEPALNAVITLGAYDVESEVFEVDVQDAANAKTPFHFVGKVGVPRDTAKTINRNENGFLASVSYLNYPFVSNGSSFNLAMKEIALSRKTMSFKSEGEFKHITGFESMEGYGTWRAHADSLLNGTLKEAGTGLDCKAASKPSKKRGGLELGWRDWTRIFTFTAAAGLGALAISKHSQAQKNNKNIKELRKNPATTDNGYEQWYNDFNSNANALKDNENARNTYGIGAGVFAIAGTLTFIF